MKKILEFLKKLWSALIGTSTKDDGPGNPPPTPPGKGNG